MKRMKVRGAPAIGIAAVFGLYLGVRGMATESMDSFLLALNEKSDYLAGSRPTAVNPFWELKRMRDFAAENSNLSVSALKARLLNEAEAIKKRTPRYVEQSETTC